MVSLPSTGGSGDHHLFTMLSEELMACETVSSAGGLSKSGRPQMLPSHLNPSPSRATAPEMERLGAEGALPKGRVRGYCISLSICCSHNSQAPVSSHSPRAVITSLLLTDVVKDRAKDQRQEELLLGQRKLNPLGIAPQFSGREAGSLL